MNKTKILTLHKLGWLNYSKIGMSLWPHLSSQTAASKIKKKLDQTNGQRMLDSDWELIEKLLP